MAIISSANLQTLLDKSARWAAEMMGDSQVVTTPNSGITIANTDVLAALQAAIDGLTDDDQNADLLPAARDLAAAPPAPHSWAGSNWSVFFAALDRHCKRYGYADLDAYLTSLNATTPTLRVHTDLATYLRRLSPANVFIPADVELARVNITGGSSGTFVDATAIDTTLYGGAKLVAKNNGALSSGPTLSISAKNLITGATDTLTVTISTLTNNNETDLSDTTKKFWDITNITVTSGGTNGNSVKIIAKTDRSVAAA